MIDEPAQKEVEQGIAAYEARRFQDAFVLLYPVLKRLQPTANYGLGTKPATQGRAVFQVLSDLGEAFPAAQYRAAKTLMFGFDGVSPDRAEGLRLLEHTARRGSPEARAHMGHHFAAQMKPIQAYMWLTLAGTNRALTFRDQMMRLTPVQIAAGRKMAADYLLSEIGPTARSPDLPAALTGP